MSGGLKHKEGTMFKRFFRRLKELIAEESWTARNTQPDAPDAADAADAAERSHSPQDKPGLTAHAFRMTLVAQGKLPQTSAHYAFGWNTTL